MHLVHCNIICKQVHYVYTVPKFFIIIHSEKECQTIVARVWSWLSKQIEGRRNRSVTTTQDTIHFTRKDNSIEIETQPSPKVIVEENKKTPPSSLPESAISNTTNKPINDLARILRTSQPRPASFHSDTGGLPVYSQIVKPKSDDEPTNQPPPVAEKFASRSRSFMSAIDEKQSSHNANKCGVPLALPSAYETPTPFKQKNKQEQSVEASYSLLQHDTSDDNAPKYDEPIRVK